MDFVFERVQWFIAIGGFAIVAMLVRLTWRGIWNIAQAEYRAINCEKREAVLEEHAAKLLTHLQARSAWSGTSSGETKNDS